VGEIDNADHPKDDRKADRHEYVEGAHDDAINEIIDKIRQGHNRLPFELLMDVKIERSRPTPWRD
jgi:hypothetical protein